MDVAQALYDRIILVRALTIVTAHDDAEEVLSKFPEILFRFCVSGVRYTGWLFISKTETSVVGRLWLGSLARGLSLSCWVWYLAKRARGLD